MDVIDSGAKVIVGAVLLAALAGPFFPQPPIPEATPISDVTRFGPAPGQTPCDECDSADEGEPTGRGDGDDHDDEGDGKEPKHDGDRRGSNRGRH